MHRSVLIIFCAALLACIVHAAAAAPAVGVAAAPPKVPLTTERIAELQTNLVKLREKQTSLIREFTKDMPLNDFRQQMRQIKIEKSDIKSQLKDNEVEPLPAPKTNPTLYERTKSAAIASKDWVVENRNGLAIGATTGLVSGAAVASISSAASKKNEEKEKSQLYDNANIGANLASRQTN